MQQFFDIFQTFGKLNKITKNSEKNGAILTKIIFIYDIFRRLKS